MIEGVDYIFGSGGDSDDDDQQSIGGSEHGHGCSVLNRGQLLDGRPKSCGVMAFHNGTEESLFLSVQREAKQGNPPSVLRAIDRYCYGRHWMMHCGDRKVKYLEKALEFGRGEMRYLHDVSVEQNKDLEPRLSEVHLICLEIGSYCGYSAVKIASTFGPSDNEFLYCIEYDARCVFHTQRMIDFAGLSHKVRVIHGSVGSSHDLFQESGLRELLMQRHGRCHFDAVFIDHDKAMYLDDLKVIESCGLLRKGSVVVADNVLSFGQPLDSYLSHVRSCGSNGLYSRSDLYKCYLEYSNAEDYVSDGEGTSTADNLDVDGLEISIFLGLPTTL